MIEFVLVLPLLLVLSMGVFEFGWAFAAQTRIVTIGRQGARVGVGMGNNGGADYFILSAMKSVLNTDASKVNFIIIYRSTTADGAVPANCLAATGGSAPRGVPNTYGTSANGGTAGCNVYSGSDLSSLSPTSFGGTAAADFSARASCTSSAWDKNWCPEDRQYRSDILYPNGNPHLDYLGVYINYQHSYLTKVWGATKTITSSTVMRIEPKEAAQ